MEENKNEKQDNVKEEKKKRVRIEDIPKFPVDGIRGRIIVFNPEKSEFAKNFKLLKKGDYFKKK
jgi:RNA polymerase subunit RPABC4/transcription elongation factor Spt4